MSEIITHECASCGIKFGLTGDYTALRRADQKRFYCPNGDTLVFKQIWCGYNAQNAQNAMAATQYGQMANSLASQDSNAELA